MSNSEIRQILVEKKRMERKMQRRAEIFEAVEGILAWSSLFVIGFALSVIGG